MIMKKLSLMYIGTTACSLILAACANPYIAEFSDHNAVSYPVEKTSISDMAVSSPPVWDGKLPDLTTMELHTSGIELTGLASQKISINLNIPQNFEITRPSEKLTTTYDKYFITGTSDPKRPVYIGDTEIERQGSKGVFGVLVNLDMGANKFTFSQGGETQTVTITRKKPSTALISEIQQASMVPAHFSGVKVGSELDLACIAPSGASVTATFNGKSVKLKQVSQAKAGVPATFKGKITVSGKYESGVTEKIGKVTYQLAYNGKTKKYTSTGDVYVAGEKSNIAVRVKQYMGFVYPNLSNLSVFKEKLKMGAVDYLKSQDNTYATLASGGAVPKEQLEVVTGTVSVGNKISKVKFASKSKSETYTFSGTNKPAYVTKLSDGKFSITFYNTTGEAKASVANSKLFSGVSVTAGERTVTYAFTQKNASLWGYNVNYDENNNTILTFRYKPRLASGSKPLDGINIVLDPGHGGTDPGALAFSPLKGPTEKDVNLAHAYAARDMLQSIGAKVALTRRDDVFYSLDDRLRAPEATNADIFVSIHHNSIGENVDANKIHGVEVYYHTGFSKKLADSMMSAVKTGTGRNARFVMQSYYRVTLSPYSPAILLELGYISNPLEYERATNQAQIDKAAKALADGIVRTLAQ